ncbi:MULTISPECIES: DedA family protein [unclassified Shewanella]|jgi:membrane protein DedA with SNARE-associated domain|uniref:DedA family protein n=2 Tax=unclassified Shewanella TaxID=196818 RepID=UPI001E496B4C|nr:DedA family protein [Shewanella sp. 10N.7]MCC4832469.1 DedA family protein [Shewanella sp. 10N.7]
MFDVMLSIWHQDFDVLLETVTIYHLMLILALILFLESSFVFLPLPGDGLVLFVGSLVGLGVVELQHAFLLLTFSAGLGSCIAYIQGRWLSHHPIVTKIENGLPDNTLQRASNLLEKYGFLALFISRFIPFVRVLTPMLMGIRELGVKRTVLMSFTSAMIWSAVLLFIGQWVMNNPMLSNHQETLNKAFLVVSLSLMLSATIAMLFRFSRKSKQQSAKQQSPR